MSRRKQSAIELAFQSLNPRAQSRRALDSETDEQMNVIGHEHVSADSDAKVSRAPTIFGKGLVHFGRSEQARTSMSVERYEINRRIGALKNQIQSRRFIFEHTLHRNVFSAPLLSRASFVRSVRCPNSSCGFLGLQR